MLSMILAAVPFLGSAAGQGTTPTLKCYGYQNFGAGDISITDPLTASTVEDPPYTDAIAPFNPQHAQAPVKDSITFNPAYISELESDDELMGVTGSGPFLDQLKASGQDVNEKVFMRQWYEPWHWDKDVDGDGDMYGPWYDDELLHGEMQWLRYLSVYELQELGWLDEDDEIYPAIMQEYTFMYVDALNIDDKPEPVPGYLNRGFNSLLFPIGIREDSNYEYFNSPYGYGLTGIDANFDANPDQVYIESEKTLFGITRIFDGNGIAADFNGNQYIDSLDNDGFQLSGDELVIFTTGDTAESGFDLEKGAWVQFLDHAIQVIDTFKYSREDNNGELIPAVKVSIWYTGDLEPEFLGYQVIDEYDMALVGRKLPVTYIRSVTNGGSGTNLCDFPTGPWFIYVTSVDFESETANIMVGRALGHTHTAMEDGQEEQDLQHGDPWWLKRFYVDGHEYNVVAIETVINFEEEPDAFMRNWDDTITDWIGPCPPGTVYPVSGDGTDANYNACYWYNDLDAAWAGIQDSDLNDDVDNNEIEDPPMGWDNLTEDYTGFKYITIRTPIPKSGQRQNPVGVDPEHEIVYTERYPDPDYSQQGSSDSDIRNLGYYHLIEQHSIRLQPYFITDMLSVLPPFNYEHTVLIDIQKNWSGIWDMDEETWVTEPQWIGPLKTLIPPITQTAGNYGTLDGRTITTEHMCYVDEDLNDQYKGELKEKLYEWSNSTSEVTGTEFILDGFGRFGDLFNDGFEGLPPFMSNTELNERWYVEQWNTIPDEYTEFILPPGGPYDEENPYLYLMTSSFWDFEAKGRILNQEFMQDEIADERFWDQDDIGPNGNDNDIPGIIGDLFGDQLLDSMIDRDGPFAGLELALYLRLIYGDFLFGSAWSGSFTNGIQYIDANRVKFWFDPAPLTTETANDIKKYKMGDSVETDGIRLYGFDSLGPGFLPATDPLVPDRDGDGDDDIIEYPPYTDPMAPFNPQSSQAPPKDSLTFDPAYMNEYIHGGEELSSLYKMISIEESDAREKVFFRMWYEPWHWDKDVNSDGSFLGDDAIWLLDPDFQEVWYWPVLWLQGKTVPTESTADGYVEEYAGQSPPILYGGPSGQGQSWEFLDPEDEIHPSLMQEFTYMYVNPYNLPDHGQPGTSRFAFPMGTRWDELQDCFGYGLTTFDCDFDGVEDICTIHSELTLARHTGIQADFNGDGVLNMLDADDVALSGDELVIFAAENVNLDYGESAMFLDYMITTGQITGNSVPFTIYRTSGATDDCIRPSSDVGSVSLEPGEMALVRQTSVTQIPVGGNNLGDPDGGWFIYVEAIDNSVSPKRCAVTMGRALGATFTAMDINGRMDNTPGDPWYLKRFYVDGHEYNVVAIMTVKEEIRQAGGWANSKEECYEFKYITIRTQIPKVPVIIQQHSVRKQEYIPCSDGTDHFISVMPPFNYDHTCKEDIQAGWATTQEELEWLSDNNYKGDVIKNKPPVKIHIEEETREPQFKGELKEKYNKLPLIEKMEIENWNATNTSVGPEFGSNISGWIDGRWVEGIVAPQIPWVDGGDNGLADGCRHWLLADNLSVNNDLIFNQTVRM